MRLMILILTTMTSVPLFADDKLTVDQQLVLAAYRVDVDGVVRALQDGADVNATFGQENGKLFQNPWDLGWPMAAGRFTPLIALACASPYPPPPRPIMNTENDLKWANEQITKIPKDKLVQRSIDSLAIAAILLSHRADLDVDDGYGATALYEAIYLKKADLAKLLLRFNAKVNSKTGVYIDGTGDVTPLHRAFWSVELTQLLLERGADAGAKDKTGRTPLDWVRDPAVARVYDRR